MKCDEDVYALGIALKIKECLQVDVAGSKHEILRSKIEIRLKKLEPLSWPTLEKSEKKAAANFSDPTVSHPPSYPSSYSKRDSLLLSSPAYVLIAACSQVPCITVAQVLCRVSA